MKSQSISLSITSSQEQLESAVAASCQAFENRPPWVHTLEYCVRNMVDEMVCVGQLPSWSQGQRELFEAMVLSEIERIRNAPPKQPRKLSMGVLKSFPMLWESLACLLPHKVRKEIFEPAHGELLADYFAFKKKARSNAKRWWLVFCFTFRSLLMVADCFRVLACERSMKWLEGLLPGPLRKWWTK